ncbi:MULTISPECIES: hypothetical protein [Enterobacteriaceae]|uniref:hypothetical protein n=1 Tax=Enterobacteriaceae TaxID=543 RepID=UPI000495C140|nr:MULTISPECIES: hypothetical protein [Enterobacteriaceae]EGT4277863.1 hypothetical protein [Cronobacter sakazakii]EGT5185995.1 hypothetical protein [Cronobacter sakazakii]EGT5666972.1 hypothetical protein [Cronobacter sakazakii]EGZ7002237.1 hypothetical protein [Cronobacter sakazakii]EGZ7011460.1 hypothetical protein [Cronobacter sakazakii]
MVITRVDVNNDIRMLMQSMEDANRPLVSPKQALSLSMLWPMGCALSYGLAMLWTFFNYEPGIDPFGNTTTLMRDYGFVFLFGFLSLLFALVISFGLYGPALAYLSLDEEVRKKSILVKRFKNLASKLGKFFFICNVGLALFSFKLPELLVASPFMLLFSFLIMQGIISAEATRYGISSIMGKLTKLAKKI